MNVPPPLPDAPVQIPGLPSLVSLGFIWILKRRDAHPNITALNPTEECHKNTFLKSEKGIQLHRKRLQEINNVHFHDFFFLAKYRSRIVHVIYNDDNNISWQKLKFRLFWGETSKISPNFESSDKISFRGHRQVYEKIEKKVTQFENILTLRFSSSLNLNMNMQSFIQQIFFCTFPFPIQSVFCIRLQLDTLQSIFLANVIFAWNI